MRFGPLIKCFQRNDFIDRHKTLLSMSCHQVREDEGARLRPESIPIMLASFFALSHSFWLHRFSSSPLKTQSFKFKPLYAWHSETLKSFSKVENIRVGSVDLDVPF